MDKKKLNNEIIFCRGAVRKARVAVIRKIIKKMKILKTCKLEAVKEKKLRKSERLFEKVQIMKKIKDDEVTKFALKNKDLEILKGSELDLKLSALVSLAKHDAVVKKVNSIKEQFLDWEKELPILLDSLESKRKELFNIKKTDTKPEKKNKKEIGKIKCTKKQKPKVDPNNKTQQELKLGTNSKEQSKESENVTENVLKAGKKVEKIEDPFFIEKKVIVPNLVLESLSNKKSDRIEFSKKSLLRKNTYSPMVHRKKFKMKQEFHKTKIQKNMPKTEEEKLHPSWAAKKLKLIKPFQGKKIMFSDD